MKTLTQLFGVKIPSLLGNLHGVVALLTRISLGWVFVGSGWGKLHNLPHVTRFFTDLGIPFPQYQAPFVASTELGCGALILIGLATRYAAIPLACIMVVAVMTAKRSDIESAADLFALCEYLYILLLGWLVALGPGCISLDNLISRKANLKA